MHKFLNLQGEVLIIDLNNYTMTTIVIEGIMYERIGKVSNDAIPNYVIITGIAIPYYDVMKYANSRSHISLRDKPLNNRLANTKKCCRCEEHIPTTNKVKACSSCVIKEIKRLEHSMFKNNEESAKSNSFATLFIDSNIFNAIPNGLIQSKINSLIDALDECYNIKYSSMKVLV